MIIEATVYIAKEYKKTFCKKIRKLVTNYQDTSRLFTNQINTNKQILYKRNKEIT